jgi:Rrf2 family transcriptional regulator, iron-sulfur cluster assembly transcription factor
VELNTRGRYAVMAMADVAHCAARHIDAGHAEGAVPLSAIAERQNISIAYLEQLFLKLRRAGLVESARGRTGGYRLTKPAADISIAEIMAAVEEGVRMTRCSGDHASPCLAGERCLTHGLWTALGDNINKFLSNVTLQQVIEGGPSERKHCVEAPAVLFTGGVRPS